MSLSIAERFLSEVCEAFILSYGNEKQAPAERVAARFDGAYFRFDGGDYFVLEQQNPNDPDHCNEKHFLKKTKIEYVNT